MPPSEVSTGLSIIYLDPRATDYNFAPNLVLCSLPRETKGQQNASLLRLLTDREEFDYSVLESNSVSAEISRGIINARRCLVVQL